MKRDNPSLSIILAAALLVALGLLGRRLVREFRGPGEVAVAPRVVPQREARVRAPRAPVPGETPARVRRVRVLGDAIGLDGGNESVVSPAPADAVPAEEPERTTVLVRSTHVQPEPESGLRRRRAPPETGVSLIYPDGVREVIATYLGQLAALFTWPDGRPQSGEWLGIGVLRDDLFRSAASRVLLGPRQGEFPVVVVGADAPQRLPNARIVFISDLAHADDAKRFFAGRPVLTATYTGASRDDTWCDVEFIWVEGQVEVLIDRAALGRRGITVSDELFKLESVSERDGHTHPGESGPGSGSVPTVAPATR